MATAIPTPLSLSRPTAPLPPLAAAALSRLERAFAPALSPELSALVDDYRSHTAHVAELAQLATTGRMSDLDADALVATEDLAAGALAALASAGRLDLIGGGR